MHILHILLHILAYLFAFFGIKEFIGIKAFIGESKLGRRNVSKGKHQLALRLLFLRQFLLVSGVQVANFGRDRFALVGKFLRRPAKPRLGRGVGAGAAESLTDTTLEFERIPSAVSFDRKIGGSEDIAGS